MPEINVGTSDLSSDLTQRLSVLEGAIVTLTTSNGVTTGFGDVSDTDEEKGDALTAAMVAAQDGDYLEVSAGDFLMRELGNYLKSNVTYFFRNSRLYIDNLSAYTWGGVEHKL